MNNLKQLIIAGLLSLFAVSSANAMLVMTVSDGTNTMVAGDTDGDGYINLTGAFGSWSITANSGFTNPFAGGKYTEMMHLNSVNVSGGVGNLTIMMSQVDFGKSNYQINVGGTSQGTVDFAAYIDAFNTSIDKDTDLSTLDKVYAEAFAATGSFAGSSFGNTPGDAFSVALVANINHTGAGQITSFDFEMKIPEPAPMA